MADVARSAADVLNVTARAGEPTGKGPLHDAAWAYDQASREAYGRPGRTSAVGTDLRLAATTLALVALVARVGRDEGAAMAALTVALTGLLDAVAELRAAQARSAQAAAARAAAEQLRGVGASWAAGGLAGAARRVATAGATRRPEGTEPPRRRSGVAKADYDRPGLRST